MKATAKKYGSGQKWYRREEPYSPYRKVGVGIDYSLISTDDISFEDVAARLCSTEDDVKKLASQEVGFKISKIFNDWRIIYARYK